MEPRRNPLGICHGGMMATLADMLLPCASMYQGRRRAALSADDQPAGGLLGRQCAGCLGAG